MHSEQILKHSTTLVPFVHEAPRRSGRPTPACTLKARAVMDAGQYPLQYSLLSQLSRDLAFRMITAEPHLAALVDCKPEWADASVALVTAAFFFLTGCLALLQTK